jgi:hypothetical protein
MSFFPLPKGVDKKMGIPRKKMLWNDQEDDNKYHLVNSKDVCQPVYQGGLEIVDLGVMNVCLLSKWLCTLENEEGLWQSLIVNNTVEEA